MPAPLGNQYALGNEGGRPSQLTPELLEKAKGYLEWCAENPVETEKVFDRDGKVLQVKTVPRLPNLARLARHLDIGRSTVNDYAEENEEFAKVVSAVRAQAEATLAEQGTAGNYASQVTTRILAAQHGYTEKTESHQEVKVSGSLNKLDDAQLAQLITSLANTPSSSPAGEASPDSGEPS